MRDAERGGTVGGKAALRMKTATIGGQNGSEAKIIMPGGQNKTTGGEQNAPDSTDAKMEPEGSLFQD